MTNRPLIFGMVTTTRSHPYTHVALQSFDRWTPLRPVDRFVLIDNNQDFTPDPAFSSCALASRIEHVRNQGPRGFAANANQLIDQALASRSDLIFMNNDLVFMKNWLPPLLTEEASIICPLCNRDVQYAISTVVPKTGHVAHVFALQSIMQLEDYLPNQAALDAINEAHQRSVTGFAPTLHAPFFCVRIPYHVLQSVGRFDEEFGHGGGEDYDYALRAYCAGFDLRVALASFILHFQGRSSWAGGESKEEQRQREETFFARFIAKWGHDLFELVLRENVSILQKAPPIDPRTPFESYRTVIRTLTHNQLPPIKL